MKSIFRTFFYLRSNYVNKEGKTPILIRIYLNREQISLGSIGLILCTEKDKTIVKYSLLNDSKQIFASKYLTYLPTEQELKKEIERERQQIEQEKTLNP